MKQKTFLCTRPKLAAELQAAGHEATPTVNPWHPDKTAWVFPLTEQTAEIIAAHYKSAGAEPPAIVRAVLA